MFVKKIISHLPLKAFEVILLLFLGFVVATVVSAKTIEIGESGDIIYLQGSVGIGTSTTAGYLLNIVGSANITGTLSSDAVSGGYTGTISAPNVSAGSFGSNTGGGNYTFPGTISASNYPPNTCAEGSSIRVINSDGTVTCETDTDTTYPYAINSVGTNGQVWKSDGSGIGGWGTDTDTDYPYAINSVGSSGQVWKSDGSGIGDWGADTDTTIDGCTNCLNATEIEDVYVLNTSDTMSGDLTVTGTLTAGSVSGGYTGTITAANVSSGSFGANTGGGNYTFPADVDIADNDLENIGVVYHDDTTRYLNRISTDGTDGGTLYNIGLYWDTSTNYLRFRGYTGVALDIQTTNVLTSTASEMTIVPNLTVSGTISGNGSGLTSLNATNLSSGTVDNARLDTDLQDLADGTLSASKVEYGTYFITSAGANDQVWKSDGTGAGVWATSTADTTVDGCSDCLGTTEIEDVYVLNTSDTMSGDLTVTGTLTAGSVSGGYTGTINAANVSAGSFASSTGGGNFTFPADVDVTGTINVGSGQIYWDSGNSRLIIKVQ